MTTFDSEHQLAGIDVTRDTFDEAVKAFGKPTYRDTHDKAGSDSGGAFDLVHVEWSLGDVFIAVVTRVPVDRDALEEVAAIRVAGRGLGFQTEAGLKVGQSLADAIERYGPPKSWDPPSWPFVDGGHLSLTIEAGRIAEIQLMSPWLAAGLFGN